MKCVVQRVSSASVSVNKKIVSKIGKGLFVLVGIKDGDTEKDAEFLAEKLTKLRIMSDQTGKMNLTVNDVGGEMLVVSQFTLYADTSGGNRPSFVKAARPEIAQPLYEYFITAFKKTPDFQSGDELNADMSSSFRGNPAFQSGEDVISKLKAQSVKVKTGKFGEYMEIETVLDGPVTVILDH
ncbi:D-tyrosyl-tRNA(Tyr) deacylase [Candidatus Microgenomates bacterium]|nr:D-tyrosyl-tRNA(Tyr) deacylase [Candidatus Microgenomates bacterium]